MIKKIQLYALIPLLSCCAVAAQQERAQALQHFQQTEETGERFEDSKDFEDLDMNIKMVRTKKIKISIKDVPFYTKVFCSYVYEEKMKKWYQVVLGYLSTSKGKNKKR